MIVSLNHVIAIIFVTVAITIMLIAFGSRLTQPLAREDNCREDKIIVIYPPNYNYTDQRVHSPIHTDHVAIYRLGHPYQCDPEDFLDATD